MKQFLNRAYKTELRMDTKLDELESLRSRAEKITTTLSHSPRGGGVNKAIESITLKIVELEEEIGEEIDELFGTYQDVRSAIKSVSDPELRLLLELRYLGYKTWGEIAYQMKYGVRQIHRMHGDALKKIKKDVTKCPEMSHP